MAEATCFTTSHTWSQILRNPSHWSYASIIPATNAATAIMITPIGFAVRMAFSAICATDHTFVAVATATCVAAAALVTIFHAAIPALIFPTRPYSCAMLRRSDPVLAPSSTSGAAVLAIAPTQSMCCCVQFLTF